MFTFLNTIILSVLAAAVIPLLIHLFNRQKTKKVFFPSIRFLKLMEKKRLRNLKLYQYLLILIRTLIIIILVLVFARPTFTGDAAGLSMSSSPVTAVIILDDGLNMRKFDLSGFRFDRARSVLISLINSFSPEDKVSVLLSHDPDHNILDSLDLNTLKCSYMPGKWNDALVSASKILEKYPNFNKEIYVISDFEFSYHNTNPFTIPGENVRVFAIPVKDDYKSNIGIDSVIIRNTIFEVNKPAQMNVIVSNRSDENMTEVSAHLFLDRKRVALKKFSIQKGEKKSLELNFQPGKSGVLQGYVELEDDDLLVDNVYYFSVTVPERINVLFVDDNPEIFIEAALNTIKNNTNVDITKETYNSWGRLRFSDYNAVCLSNFPDIPDVLISRLQSYLKQGGGVILIPGMNSLTTKIRNITEKLNLQELITSGSHESYFSLKRLGPRLPFFAGLFRNENSEISKPQFLKYFKIAPGSRFKSLLNFNNEDPYLVKTTDPDNIYLLSSYPGKNWSDIYLKGIFVPLLTRLFQSAGLQGQQFGKQFITGNRAAISIEQHAADNFYQLRDPDEILTRILPQQNAGGNNTIFFNLHKPGNYILNNKNSVVHIISSNINTNSLRPPFIEIENLINNDIRTINTDTNFIDMIQNARFGTEIWKYLVFIIILLVCVEYILVKKTEGQGVFTKK